jgi:hypothetical protein
MNSNCIRYKPSSKSNAKYIIIIYPLYQTVSNINILIFKEFNELALAVDDYKTAIFNMEENPPWYCIFNLILHTQ